MGEKDLREAAFLGRITAAFTHEMKNVLAIIKESAGLMEDLLALSQEATFPQRDRFVRCLTTIAAQTKRGVELSGRLNRFAHSPDQDIATVDLNDILEQVVFLSGRFARLKGVTLRPASPWGSLERGRVSREAANGGLCLPRMLLGDHGRGWKYLFVGYAGRQRGHREVLLSKWWRPDREPCRPAFRCRTARGDPGNCDTSELPDSKQLIGSGF